MDKEAQLKRIHRLLTRLEKELAPSRKRQTTRGGVLRLHELPAPMNELRRLLRSTLDVHIAQLSPGFFDEVIQEVQGYVAAYHAGQRLPTRDEMMFDFAHMVMQNVTGYIQPPIVTDIAETIVDYVRRVVFR